MKKILLLVLLACLAASCKAQKEAAADTVAQPVREDPPGEYAPHSLIIFYDTQVGSGPLLKAVKRYKAEVIYQYRIINAIAIRTPKDRDIHEAMAYFGKVKGVLTVNRDRIYHLHDEKAKTQIQ